MRLKHRTALITGAGRGIGRAIAEHFAREGARVAITDLDLDTASETARAIRDAGGEALALAMDVTDEQAVEQGFQELADQWGCGYRAGQCRCAAHRPAAQAGLR